MRLIDADRLCNDLVRRWDLADTEKENLIRAVMADVVTPIVASQPTIDAVPVVRCMDCKHKIINDNVPRRPLICCRTLKVGETDPDWFCADGERMNGE